MAQTRTHRQYGRRRLVLIGALGLLVLRWVLAQGH